MTQNCGDPNCKDCNPVKPIVLRTKVLNSLGEEIGFAEPPIPDGQGGFLESVMLTESGDHFGRPEATIEQLMDEVFGGAKRDAKMSNPITVKPRQLRFTNRRTVVTYGLKNRYNPCSVCGKPTRSMTADREPLCGKCSKGQ